MNYVSTTPREPGVWTGAQKALAAALVMLGLGLTAIAFTMIYFTVTHLLRSAMGAWAWTVVASGEAAFLFLFLTGVLLALRKAPAGALRGLLMLALFAGSVLLNVYGSWGSPPAVAGHVLIVVTFFGCLLTGKSTLLRLLGGKVRADRITLGEWVAHPLHSLRLSRWMVTWAEPSRERAHARYMALLFAIALVQADPDIGRTPFAWRRRLPVTLRYQLETGQFPAALQAAIDGGGDWQEAVTEHVRQHVHLPSLERTPGVPANAPEAVSAGVPQPVSSTHARPSRSASPGAIRKPSASAVKRMSGADLAPYVGTLLETTPGLSQADVMKTLRIGAEKAREALRLAKRDRLQSVAK